MEEAIDSDPLSEHLFSVARTIHSKWPLEQ